MKTMIIAIVVAVTIMAIFGIASSTTKNRDKRNAYTKISVSFGFVAMIIGIAVIVMATANGIHA